MARFRQYKNGIFGHRYKNYFIIRNDSDNGKNFGIIDADQISIQSGLSNYWDCEWYIDKLTFTQQDTSIAKRLYAYEIYELNKLFVQLTEKKSSGNLSPEERNLLEMVIKIRDRKADDKPY